MNTLRKIIATVLVLFTIFGLFGPVQIVKADAAEKKENPEVDLEDLQDPEEDEFIDDEYENDESAEDIEIDYGIEIEEDLGFTESEKGYTLFESASVGEDLETGDEINGATGADESSTLEANSVNTAGFPSTFKARVRNAKAVNENSLYVYKVRKEGKYLQTSLGKINKTDVITITNVYSDGSVKINAKVKNGSTTKTMYGVYALLSYFTTGKAIKETKPVLEQTELYSGSTGTNSYGKIPVYSSCRRLTSYDERYQIFAYLNNNWYLGWAKKSAFNHKKLTLDAPIGEPNDDKFIVPFQAHVLSSIDYTIKAWPGHYNNGSLATHYLHGQENKVKEIDKTKTVYVNAVYPDGAVRVTCTAKNGDRLDNVYTKLRYLTSGNGTRPEIEVMNDNTKVYWCANAQNECCKVDAKTMCRVLANSKSMYQVIFTRSNTNYIGWIKKTNFLSELPKVGSVISSKKWLAATTSNDGAIGYKKQSATLSDGSTYVYIAAKKLSGGARRYTINKIFRDTSGVLWAVVEDGTNDIYTKLANFSNAFAERFNANESELRTIKTEYDYCYLRLSDNYNFKELPEGTRYYFLTTVQDGDFGFNQIAVVNYDSNGKESGPREIFWIAKPYEITKASQLYDSCGTGKKVFQRIMSVNNSNDVHCYTDTSTNTHHIKFDFDGYEIDVEEKVLWELFIASKSGSEKDSILKYPQDKTISTFCNNRIKQKVENNTNPNNDKIDQWLMYVDCLSPAPSSEAGQYEWTIIRVHHGVQIDEGNPAISFVCDVKEAWTLHYDRYADNNRITFNNTNEIMGVKVNYAVATESATFHSIDQYGKYHLCAERVIDGETVYDTIVSGVKTGVGVYQLLTCDVKGMLKFFKAINSFIQTGKVAGDFWSNVANLVDATVWTEDFVESSLTPQQITVEDGTNFIATDVPFYLCIAGSNEDSLTSKYRFEDVSRVPLTKVRIITIIRGRK